jgi:hypothetical protein
MWMMLVKCRWMMRVVLADKDHAAEVMVVAVRAACVGREAGAKVA